MGVAGAAAITSAMCLRSGVPAAEMTPPALGGDGNGSIGQGFINGVGAKTYDGMGWFVDASALNQTELRAAKRG